MQLIKGGPDIPERLLQAHEEGRVVFFCGAGISYPAGLPGFGGLTKRIFDGLAVPPVATEIASIRSNQFDTAIGLLESRIVGRRFAVRQELARQLKPTLTLPRALDTHRALLTLSRSRKNNYHLITTNFDVLFEEVIKQDKLPVQKYKAPLLPVPKSRWDGLVYLHGLLPDPISERELNCLVVSSGDFGLAYLIERWAARFVSELFRTYNVCFVGYSINDPVMRYVMDALAADRLLGETPPEAFAFGSYKKGKKKNSEDDWGAKNVTPILYEQSKAHHHLHETLHAWADLYRDGVLGKEQIVTQHASGRPPSSTVQDDIVGRVLWALAEPSGRPAKRFAEMSPAPPIEWLEPLTERRFRHRDLSRFGVQANPEEDKKLQFSILSRPLPYSLATGMAVAHPDPSLTGWDAVMANLARWLVRHLDEPKLFLWVVAQGRWLHPHFSNMIDAELNRGVISQPMRTLWRLALAGRVRSDA